MAGAGSLSIEFGMLSYLSNDSRYEEAAYRSVHRLYSARTPLGLVGKHIHIQSGSWTEASSGIGFNVDSFYEYIIANLFLEFSIENAERMENCP